MLSKSVYGSDTLMSTDITCLWAVRQPVYRRHELWTGLSTERGNLSFRSTAMEAKTALQWFTIVCLPENGGGAVRSSVESSVMDGERRDCIIWSEMREQPR